MKANEGDLVRTVEAVDYMGRILPAGMVGAVVEAYTKPTEGYSVDLELGDGDFAPVVLKPAQFEVVTADPGV